MGCEYLVIQLTTKQPLYSCAVKYLFLSVRQLIRLVTLWLKSKSASGTVCFQTTQKYRSLANIIRLNASPLYIFKLKNQSELDAFIEESSALVDKKTLLEIYKEATKEPYSFLYININSKDINKTFYIRFEKAFQIE